MRKSSRIQKSDLIKATHDCFSHKMGGTLSDFLYSDPDTRNDLDCGVFLWDAFLKEAGEDYYLAYDEPKLIEASAQQIADITGPYSTVIDFAPGTVADRKTRPLIAATGSVKKYIPIDLAHEFTKNAAHVVKDYNPDIVVEPLIRDFINFKSKHEAPENAVGLFFGSTISNMPGKTNNGMPNKALIRTLRNIRTYLPVGGHLIITHDANQDETEILKSYSHEMNQRFALNVLRRIKRDLHTEGFDPRAFQYRRNWVPEKNLLAHFAVSVKAQNFKIEGRSFHINESESFNIINSYKYLPGFFEEQAVQAGFELVKTFWDDKKRIALHVLKVMPDAVGPSAPSL